MQGNIHNDFIDHLNQANSNRKMFFYNYVYKKVASAMTRSLARPSPQLRIQDFLSLENKLLDKLRLM